MKIGTVRPEEARVFDQYAGYHHFHAEETQEPNGSFEIFWHNGGDMNSLGAEAREDCEDDEFMAAGWYWRACFPGCMPDGDPMGPFATSRDALQDADEWNPEFDE